MIGILTKYNWLFPILVLFSLLLGTLGFYQYAILHNVPPDWLSSIYLSLQLFVLNSGGVPGPIPLTLEVSRFLAPALTAGGIFLAIWEPLHRNFLLYKIRFWKGHVVVCGLSKKAELLILNFLEDPKEKFNVVLIESDTAHSSISNFRKRGVIVLEGNATDEEMLHKANILQAGYLLALTNDENTNILIAQKATSLYNQFPAKIPANSMLQVIIHIDDFYTMKIFKEFHEKAVPENAKFRKGSTQMDYHAFSIYQLGAIYMVDNFSPDKHISLKNENDPPAHILIFGDNLAAEYLILEVAQMYHFANLQKTRITVVSEDIGSLAGRINGLYPMLEKAVELKYVSVPDFFKNPCTVPCDEISMCFMALDNDGESIFYSRKLRQHLFNNCKATKEESINSFYTIGNFSQAKPPIKVLLPRDSAVVNIFEDIISEMWGLNIEILNLDDEVCNKKTIVDNRKEEDFIAKHIHYEWAQNQAEKNKTVIGTMQQEWDKLKDAQKDSNRLPARHLFHKLRYVNAEFTEEGDGEELLFESLKDSEWDRIARMEHNRWMAEKNIGGFVLMEKPEKKLGAFLKDNLKCHWDLVPFDHLDEGTRQYDTFTFRMAPVIAHLNKKRIRKILPRK